MSGGERWGEGAGTREGPPPPAAASAPSALTQRTLRQTGVFQLCLSRTRFAHILYEPHRPHRARALCLHGRKEAPARPWGGEGAAAPSQGWPPPPAPPVSGPPSHPATVTATPHRWHRGSGHARRDKTGGAERPSSALLFGDLTFFFTACCSFHLGGFVFLYFCFPGGGEGEECLQSFAATHLTVFTFANVNRVQFCCII